MGTIFSPQLLVLLVGEEAESDEGAPQLWLVVSVEIFKFNGSTTPLTPVVVVDSIVVIIFK